MYSDKCTNYLKLKINASQHNFLLKKNNNTDFTKAFEITPVKHHTHKDTTVHTQSICLLPYTASTHVLRIRTAGTLAFPLIYLPCAGFFNTSN